jgi:cysteinyl-tRNA synthetase
MAKGKTARGGKGAVHFSLTHSGPDATWLRMVERCAKEHGKSVEQAMTEALRDWLWQASGLKRMFEQFRESNEHMTRAFQVEGMLVRLAKSGGISLGDQSDYLKRAQQEREQYAEQRKKIVRLIKDIRRVAEETQLPGAAEAAAKLVVPD